MGSVNSYTEAHNQNVSAVECPANIGQGKSDVVRPTLEEVERRSKAVQTEYNWEDPSHLNPGLAFITH